MRRVVRFYGSCGHVVDDDSVEGFDAFAAPKEVVDLASGERRPFRNEVTTEPDGTKVVHVHPFRYCPCLPCIEADLAAEAAQPADGTT